MAQTMIDKGSEVFKSFLTGKKGQFEMQKFHEWIKANGELQTDAGVLPARFRLDGGTLEEMVITYRNGSGTPRYSLKQK